MHPGEVDSDALAFFNDLSGRLQIELTEPPQREGNLLNLAAPPTARLVNLHVEWRVYEDDGTRPLRDDEWNRTVMRAPALHLRGEAGEPVEHTPRSPGVFTVRDLATAIEETERRTRGDTDWSGGIDVHHVYYEGIEAEEDGSWSVSWGS